MTLDELRTILDELAETLPGDTEVKIASQPSYPFEHSIAQVATYGTEEYDIEDAPNAMEGLEGDDLEEAQKYLEELKGRNTQVIYIAEGSQQEYLLGGVSQKLGWR